MRDIVMDLGDLHAVAALGVHPPEFHTRFGYNVGSTKAATWLWESMLELRDYAASLRRTGDHLTVVFNGDIGDSAWKHPTNQLLTYDLCDALKIIEATTRPWLDVADAVFLSAGTEAHAGLSGELEAAAAECIGAQPLPSDPAQRVWDVVRLEVQGVRLDFAHTGRIGGRPWTLTNGMAGNYLEVLAFYFEMGWAPPHLVGFSHVHRASDTGDNFPIRVLTTPGWLLRAYHYNRSPYRLADIGGTLIVVEDGQLTQVKNCKFKPRAEIMGADVWRRT